MIECVNRARRIVIDDNGNCGVITHFFDGDGEDCEPQDAVSCVAECDGKHYAIDLKEYENVFSN